MIKSPFVKLIDFKEVINNSSRIVRPDLLSEAERVKSCWSGIERETAGESDERHWSVYNLATWRSWKNCVRRMVNDEEIFTKFVWIDNAKHILRDTGPVACLPKIICLLSSDGSSTRMTAVRSLVTSSKRRTRQRMDFHRDNTSGHRNFFFDYSAL